MSTQATVKSNAKLESDNWFKGATAKLYSMLRTKSGVNATQLAAFRKTHQLRSAYQILFRLRRIGIAWSTFTVTATGDLKSNRVYHIVPGVAKNTPENWVKALPVRGTKSAKPAAKKAVAKAATKKVAKRATKPVLAGAGEDDDAAIDE